jgi:hypothetical protein
MQERTADRTAIYTLAGVIAAATIAFIGTEWAARTSFDAQMVQVGVGILSADPGKSDVAPARKWAVDLVEKHSGMPFSAEDRESLLHHPILSAATQETMEREYPCLLFNRNADGSWTGIWDKSVGPVEKIPAGSEAARSLDAKCKG